MKSARITEQFVLTVSATNPPKRVCVYGFKEIISLCMNKERGSDAHLPLEVEEAQGLELHCGFSPQIWGQRAWQALQFLDPVCNSSLQSEE